MIGESTNRNIPIEVKVKNREAMQTKTYKEALRLLHENGKCLVVRPTGTGKTHIMASLTKNEDWDRVFFLYPRNVIKEQVKYKEEMGEDSRVQYISYAKLSRVFQDGTLVPFFKKLRGMKVLFLFDEAHFCGADITSEAIRILMITFPEFYYLGATATPIRPDGFSIQDELFDNSEVYRYTRHRAIVEGVLDPPYYVLGQFDLKTQLLSEGKKRLGNQKFMKPDSVEYKEALETLNNKVLEASRFENIAGLLKTNIEKCIEDTDYMKFLVYFSRVNLLKERKDDVIKWFSTAFPDMIVNPVVVVRGDKKALQEVLDLERVEGKIDLIFCVDMISYGYHVDDLTGEVLLRLTSSNILLNQQIGRCLSTMNTSSKIIFDLVGNVNVSPFLDELGDSEEDLDGGDDIENPGKGGDSSDVFLKGDLVLVDQKFLDIDAALRFCDLDEFALEDAVARAMEKGIMPYEVAIEELKQYGVVDKKGVDLVIEESRKRRAMKERKKLRLKEN